MNSCLALAFEVQDGPARSAQAFSYGILEDQDQEEITTSYPPRPNTPIPYRRATSISLPSLMSDFSDEDSSGSSTLPTPVDEYDRAEAFARFSSGIALPSALTTAFHADFEDEEEEGSEEETAEYARMIAFSLARSNYMGKSFALCYQFVYSDPSFV